MYSRYRILTRGLLAIMPREELTELQFWEATDKTTIKSLSIIQRTQTKTFRYKTFRALSIATRFEYQVMGLLFNPIPEVVTCNIWCSLSAINILSTDMSTSNVTSKITKSEEGQKVEEEKKSEDHEFTYQNPILKNPEILSQQQQQLPPPQQQQMTYTSIMKLNKFNGEEDDVQVWLNNVAKAITANNWDDTRVMQRRASATTVVNKSTLEPTAILIAIHNQEINIETPIASSRFRTITQIKTNTNPLTCL
ncbi:hypothetical protein G9A89_019733 [Geosiphon pyriformis]|nr:hypothetical protein G9A89_019733 [Geosiphon pyriformis]